MADDLDEFATGGGLEIARTVVEMKDDELIGHTLGGYQITALIAEGGMSRVYKGQRIDGTFDRDVAVKVSAAGLPGR